jgi:hypothetical protein
MPRENIDQLNQLNQSKQNKTNINIVLQNYKFFIIIGLILFYNFINDVYHIIGLLYPAYCSYKVKKSEIKTIIKYWIMYSIITVFGILIEFIFPLFKILKIFGIAHLVYCLKNKHKYIHIYYSYFSSVIDKLFELNIFDNIDLDNNFLTGITYKRESTQITDTPNTSSTSNISNISGNIFGIQNLYGYIQNTYSLFENFKKTPTLQNYPVNKIDPLRDNKQVINKEDNIDQMHDEWYQINNIYPNVTALYPKNSVLPIDKIINSITSTTPITPKNQIIDEPNKEIESLLDDTDEIDEL